MILLIVKLLTSIAILYGLYLLYGRKAQTKHQQQVARVSKEEPSRNLQIKLLRLLNGDHNTANRLIALAKTRNPNKSIDWCVEKVIFDLQRDRGRY